MGHVLVKINYSNIVLNLNANKLIVSHATIVNVNRNIAHVYKQKYLQPLKQLKKIQNMPNN
jgi:hypothetical protein